ncbi:TetR/AcrR family transcriptional regulator [Nocardia sp. NPDC024068]|uniref:TetR/AcrR family transcriptional regulator n=1 Tax=Nocardia sp. NPDC024068 TaxID=3157197 RepID=UPI0033E661D6
MGQKEQLLAGARTCIVERGYANTTARDIANASGAHLASIGYHFGTKDALINAAVLEIIEEWGERLTQAGSLGAGPPAQRLQRFIEGILAAGPDERRVLVASVQSYALSEFVPELREQLRQVYATARRDIAALVLGIERDAVSAEQAEIIGSVALSLINGAVLQWLADPTDSRGASRIAAAVSVLASQHAP